MRLGEVLCVERGEVMSRIRLVFEKRDFACFVRHVELPQLFGRIARRAGLKVELTQGMSPHPHIVMGPALPVGVISIYECAEVWFAENVGAQEALEKLNANAPGGFRFMKAARIAPDTMSLNKCLDAAAYWMCLRNGARNDEALEAIRQDFSSEVIVKAERVPDGTEFVIHDPSQTGPGAIVKALAAREIISGWPEICMARLCIGRWRNDRGELTPIL